MTQGLMTQGLAGQHAAATRTAAAGVDLSGRTAVVTGGGSGIGRACAVRLAQAGAAVIVVDLDQDSAASTAQAIGGTAYVADLTDTRALHELEATGEIVVNNAGFQHIAPLEEFPPERFAALLRVMVEAPFRLIQGSLPRMYAAGYGRIVNISSVHGLRASPFKSGYVAGKHGLEGLSKVAALEGGPKGVTSNCINPSYVRTPLVDKQIAAQAESRGIAESDVIEKVMLADSAVKRLVEPQEVAELAVYLCSEEAALINGASLCMDGGWTAH